MPRRRATALLLKPSLNAGEPRLRAASATDTTPRPVLQKSDFADPARARSNLQQPRATLRRSAAPWRRWAANPVIPALPSRPPRSVPQRVSFSPITQDCVGAACQPYDFMAALLDQRCEPARPPGRRPQRRRAAGTGGAQWDDRAATVALSATTLPARISRSSTVRSIDSVPRCSVTVDGRLTLSPSRVTRISPARTPACRRRTIFRHPHNHQPPRLSGFDLQCLRYENRLKSQAEPPPLDAALAQERLEHPVNRNARNYQDLPPRTKVEMPRRPPPAASSTGPPSSRSANVISRAMRRSMRPPARLCHAGPTEWIVPSRIERPPLSAPKASASAPGRGSGPKAATVRRVPSNLKTTTLVPGSRPASRPVQVPPSRA